MKVRWGENKPIFEEGLIGGLVGGAVGLAVASVVMPSGVLYAMTARLGFIDDPAALAWFWENSAQSVAFSACFVLSGAVGALLGFQKLVKQPSQWHWDGMEYVDEPGAGAAKMQANEQSLMSAEQRLGVTGGVLLGGVELSRTREVSHLSLVGLPGAGKTVVINSLLQQIFERGDRAILHDPKGDFTAWVYGADAVMLGPWDARARWWDLSADLRSPEMATTFAGAIFPEEGGGDNKFFTDAAREVVAGLIKFYMRAVPGWSWDTLADDLSKGALHVISTAQRGDPNVRILITNPEDRTAQSIMSEVARGTSWIAPYASAFQLQRDDLGELDTDSAFSVTKWLEGSDHGEIARVILNNDARFEVRSQQIFGALAACVASHLNSSQMPEIGADEAGLWVVLDEYPQLGQGVAKHVQKIEELGRSRGVRVVKSLQDESQLFAAAGREKGEAQRSVQQTRIYTKMASGTASDISKKLGDRDVIRIEFPQAVGAGNKRATTTRLPVIRVDELTGLRVRKDPAEPPVGVELVVHTDDVLVKLVQSFPTVKEIEPKVIPSEGWERGILDLAARAEAGSGGGRSHELGPAMEPEPEEYDEIDVPGIAPAEPGARGFVFDMDFD